MIRLRAGVLTTVELASAYAVTHVEAERIFVFLVERPTPLLLVGFLISERTALREDTASDFELP